MERVLRPKTLLRKTVFSFSAPGCISPFQQHSSLRVSPQQRSSPYYIVCYSFEAFHSLFAGELDPCIDCIRCTCFMQFERHYSTKSFILDMCKIDVSKLPTCCTLPALVNANPIDSIYVERGCTTTVFQYEERNSVLPLR